MAAVILSEVPSLIYTSLKFGGCRPTFTRCKTLFIQVQYSFSNQKQSFIPMFGTRHSLDTKFAEPGRSIKYCQVYASHFMHFCGTSGTRVNGIQLLGMLLGVCSRLRCCLF